MKLPGRTQSNHNGPYKWEPEILGRGNATMGREAGVMHFDDGGKRHNPKNAGSLQNLEKTRKQILP